MDKVVVTAVMIGIVGVVVAVAALFAYHLAMAHRLVPVSAGKDSLRKFDKYERRQRAIQIGIVLVVVLLTALMIWVSLAHGWVSPALQ